MKPSFIIWPAAFAAGVGAVLVIFASTGFAQSDRDRGLTGDPLIDSILQAPGPGFLDDSGEGADDHGYRDEDPPAPDGWADDADDGWDAREPETAARSGVPRVPPPAPERRGEGPLDIAILDTDEHDRPAGQPEDGHAGSDTAADDTAEPSYDDTADRPDQDTAAESEPAFREQTQQDPAPLDERGEPEDPEQLALGEPTGTRAPAEPSQAPARPKPDPELNRMIGQMLLVGFPGVRPSDAGVKNAARQLEEGDVGGVILMSRNIESPDQVRRLTRHLAEAAEGQPTPFIGVDQEGGYVQRLARTKGFKTHPSAERLGARNDPQGAYSAYRNLALELRDYGFNLNFGPVVDLNINPANPVIGRLKRSFGKNPDHVSAFAKAFVFAHNESGVLTAAKHFPGHGSSETDSHDELVDISQSWTEKELRPYRELIEAQAIDMIMVGHLSHPSFSDTADTPVSLSKKGVTNVLRDSLNYDGVVITDDLDMRGVRQNASFEKRILGAVEAGNDILLITNSNDPESNLAKRVRSVIRQAIDAGRLSIERIRASYQRIMALKDELSRLQRTATSAGEDRGLADHSSGG
ncbi:MAG: glycoside hydrolase family 3 N-terminal domain-containing protein [Dichotomicrobium sp.]